VAIDNLARMAPLRPDNTGLVIDTASLSPAQQQYTAQILPQLRAAGLELPDAAVSDSLAVIPAGENSARANIVIITAENDAELRRKLIEVGKSGQLEGKHVLLASCGDADLSDLVTNGYVSEYGLTGLTVFSDQILPETVPVLVTEMLRAGAASDLTPPQILRAAVDSLTAQLQSGSGDLAGLLQQMGIPTETFEDGLRRLHSFWSQISLLPPVAGPATA